MWFGVGFALAYTALDELHAGFGQTLLALVPLLALLFAVLHRQERLGLDGARRCAGGGARRGDHDRRVPR